MKMSEYNLILENSDTTMHIAMVEKYPDIQLSGRPLVSLQNDVASIPLVAENERGALFSGILADVVRHVMHEKAYAGKAAFWKYLPFNYRKVPVGLRNLILAHFMSKKAVKPDDGRVKAFVDFLDVLRNKKFDFAANDVYIFFQEQPLLILSHDIDTGEGFDWVLPIAEVEESLGFRSTWNIVTGEYGIRGDILEKLVSKGHSIGWHELIHDNKFPFLDRGEMDARISESMWFIEKYKVKGFRSPSYLFTSNMFESLKNVFSYDSSRLDYDDISRNSPRGCCCPYPFLLESGLLEIPVTIPFEMPFLKKQYHTGYWNDKIDFLIKNNALLHVNTHPDPHYSGNDNMIAEYAVMLKSIKEKQVKNRLAEEISGDING